MNHKDKKGIRRNINIFEQARLATPLSLAEKVKSDIDEAVGGTGFKAWRAQTRFSETKNIKVATFMKLLRNMGIFRNNIYQKQAEEAHEILAPAVADYLEWLSVNHPELLTRHKAQEISTEALAAKKGFVKPNQ